MAADTGNLFRGFYPSALPLGRHRDERPLNVILFSADSEKEWNCSEWLIAIICRALVKAGHNAKMFPITDFMSQPTLVHLLCKEADIIVIERNLIGQALNEIVYWRRQGKPVVAVFDDAYHLLPTTHVVYGHWRAGLLHSGDGDLERVSKTPVEQFTWGLHLVSAFMSPGQELVKRWAPHCKGYYSPNYLDLPLYQGLKADPWSIYSPREIRIGWGGSVSHWESVENAGVIPGLKRVFAKHPECRLIVQTSDPRVLKSMRDIPEAQREYRKWVPFKEWPQSMYSWDIALTVAKGPYDAARSIIHLTEPLAVDPPIPVLASNDLPYSEFGKYVRLVDNKPKPWEAALMDAVENLQELRAEVAGAPHQWALSYAVDDNIDKVVAIYREIIENEKANV
jgi:hypothetical protein